MLKINEYKKSIEARLSNNNDSYLNYSSNERKYNLHYFKLYNRFGIFICSIPEIQINIAGSNDVLNFNIAQ